LKAVGEPDKVEVERTAVRGGMEMTALELSRDFGEPPGLTW
jgi:hypothetical protein